MDHRVDDYLALCQAVGHIVVEWSLVERQFDNWISVAFKQCEGYKLRKNADLPVSFKQKKEFLNDCFKKLPILGAFKEEGLGLVNLTVSVKTMYCYCFFVLFRRSDECESAI